MQVCMSKKSFQLLFICRKLRKKSYRKYSVKNVSILIRSSYVDRTYIFAELCNGLWSLSLQLTVTFYFLLKYNVLKTFFLLMLLFSCLVWKWFDKRMRKNFLFFRTRKHTFLLTTFLKKTTINTGVIQIFPCIIFSLQIMLFISFTEKIK